MKYRGKVIEANKEREGCWAYVVQMHHPKVQEKIINVRADKALGASLWAEVVLTANYSSVKKVLTIEEVMEESKPKGPAALGKAYLGRVLQDLDEKKMLVNTGAYNMAEVEECCDRAFALAGTCWQAISFKVDGRIIKVRELSELLDTPYFIILAFYHTHSTCTRELLTKLDKPCYKFGGSYFTLSGIAKTLGVSQNVILDRAVLKKYLSIYNLDSKPVGFE